jgi:hypothetical protein
MTHPFRTLGSRSECEQAGDYEEDPERHRPSHAAVVARKVDDARAGQGHEGYDREASGHSVPEQRFTAARGGQYRPPERASAGS